MYEQMLAVMTILSGPLNPNKQCFQCPDQSQPTQWHEIFDECEKDLLAAQVAQELEEVSCLCSRDRPA